MRSCAGEQPRFHQRGGSDALVDCIPPTKITHTHTRRVHSRNGTIQSDRRRVVWSVCVFAHTRKRKRYQRPCRQTHTHTHDVRRGCWPFLPKYGRTLAHIHTHTLSLIAIARTHTRNYTSCVCAYMLRSIRKAAFRVFGILVSPSYRRRRLARRVFNYCVPRIREECLLHVLYETRYPYRRIPIYTHTSTPQIAYTKQIAM